MFHEGLFCCKPVMIFKVLSGSQHRARLENHPNGVRTQDPFWCMINAARALVFSAGQVQWEMYQVFGSSSQKGLDLINRDVDRA